MILKDRAVMDEQCCMCDRVIPNGRMILRHPITKKILCVLCLVAIAEMS